MHPTQTTISFFTPTAIFRLNLMPPQRAQALFWYRGSRFFLSRFLFKALEYLRQSEPANLCGRFSFAIQLPLFARKGGKR